MKWMYIPSMFALAFFYTKITFDDFMPKQATEMIARAPAAEEMTCKELLKLFYPGQSSEFLDARINANKDFHSFFRAFSPIFYHELKNINSAGVFKSLEKYQGTIAGDLHLENFGFLIDDKGKVLFTLNDFDEATKGELHYDVIRHFLSAKIVEKNISWDKYFSAYKKGLEGEARSNSFYIEKGIEEVGEITAKNFKKHVSSELPFKFIKFKSPHRGSTEVESKELSKALRQKFPKIEVFDHYVRIKEDGGSAGLKRYQVLARVEPQAKLQWLDIKESAPSGYDKVFGKIDRPFEERLMALKANIYDNKMDKSIEVVKIEGHPFALRFVDQFSSALKLEDIPADDYNDIILDQAYAIGRMHSLSLKDSVPAYLKAWKGISKHAIEESLVELKFRLNDIYKESIKKMK